MFQSCLGNISPRRGGGGVPRDIVLDAEDSDDDDDDNAICYASSSQQRRQRRQLLDDPSLMTGASLSSSRRSTSKPQPQQQQHQRSANILLEIVGATALQGLSQSIDTFCIVKVADTEIHRTKTISNDFQPIFTCKTKALCLLKNLKEHDKVEVQLCRPNKIVPGAFKVIGSTTDLDFKKLVEGNGKRYEFNICKDDNMILLALRFREATAGDILYFSPKEELGLTSSRSLRDNITYNRQLSLNANATKDHASDIDFKNVTKKSILQQHQKLVQSDKSSNNNKKEKEVAYRVFPGPDPDDPANTTFMTLKQMDGFLDEPSREWVEAGWGDFGAVYVEILGCDNLPQMDTKMIDGLTDPFAGIVFEDTFVRSSVIFDNLNPRWPPWSQRAVKFNISHPSSVIYVGIFDYDEMYLDDHDPIGRVVLHLDTFEPDTVYTLKYALFNGDAPQDTVSSNTGSLDKRLCCLSPLIDVFSSWNRIKEP